MTKRGNSWGRKAARQYSPMASVRAGWKPRGEGEQGKASGVRIGSGTDVKRDAQSLAFMIKDQF